MSEESVITAPAGLAGFDGFKSGFLVSTVSFSPPESVITRCG